MQKNLSRIEQTCIFMHFLNLLLLCIATRTLESSLNVCIHSCFLKRCAHELLASSYTRLVWRMREFIWMPQRRLGRGSFVWITPIGRLWCSHDALQLQPTVSDVQPAAGQCSCHSQCTSGSPSDNHVTQCMQKQLKTCWAKWQHHQPGQDMSTLKWQVATSVPTKCRKVVTLDKFG